jgi:predicted transcriptional regulator YdeE
MENITIKLPEIKLVGITVRTSTAAEMNPLTAKIGTQIQKYFQQHTPEKIANRKKPGTTYCVYTEYESDYTGEYTYFVGEEVEAFDKLAEGFVALTIPEQTYIKFTNGPGAMPLVCISVWQKVWQMEQVGGKGLGGKREYIADFEVYDERAMDPQNAALDVYVGIKK